MTNIHFQFPDQPALTVCMNPDLLRVGTNITVKASTYVIQSLKIVLSITSPANTYRNQLNGEISNVYVHLVKAPAI